MLCRVVVRLCQASRTNVCVTKVALYTHLVLVFGDRGERDDAKDSRLGRCQGGEGCTTLTDYEGWETMVTNARARGRHGRSVQRLANVFFHNVLT